MKKYLGALIPLSLILLLILVIVIAFVASNGQPVITGNWTESETTDTLSCEANGIKYPFFDYDNSTAKDIRVNVVFTEEKFSSISLVYKMYYSDANLIKASINSNNADMGISFAESGMASTALNISFTPLDNAMQMSLHASSGELTSVSAKYFMLNEYNNDSSKSELRKNYESQGFECKTKNA